jgi:hypothetical protein
MPLIRLRMYGSTETKTFSTSASPSPGSASGSSRSSKSDSFGMPSGRARRTIARLTS